MIKINVFIKHTESQQITGNLLQVFLLRKSKYLNVCHFWDVLDSVQSVRLLLIHLLTQKHTKSVLVSQFSLKAFSIVVFQP